MRRGFEGFKGHGIKKIVQVFGAGEAHACQSAALNGRQRTRHRTASISIAIMAVQNTRHRAPVLIPWNEANMTKFLAKKPRSTAAGRPGLAASPQRHPARRPALAGWMAAVALVPAIVFAVPACAADKQEQLVARGKYIVSNVGMCSDCHTVRDEHGELRLDKLLQGSPLPFSMTHPVPGFVGYAPKIAGLPAGFTETQVATFLHTGLDPHGQPAHPPMPQFRMDVADSRAVAAYLKSLK